MKRWFVYSLTVIALVMLLLTIGAWWHSYYVAAGDDLQFRKSSKVINFESRRGIVHVAWGESIVTSIPQADGWLGNMWPANNSLSFPPYVDRWEGTRFGFLYDHVKHSGWLGGPVSEDIHELRLPWYFLTLLPLLALAICSRAIFRYARQWSRQKHGYCKACGYDLRASVDKCPECGVEIFAKGKSA